MAKYTKVSIRRTREYKEAKADLTGTPLGLWVILATTHNLVFRLEFSREVKVTGQWAIVGPDEFWMNAYDTREEALAACEEMGWKVEDTN